MERKSLSLILALVAILASMAGNLIILWQDWQLYSGILASPSSAHVWLGGRGIHALIVSMVTFIIASPLAVGGILVSFWQRRMSTGLVSTFAMLFTLTPLPLAFWLDGKIIAVTGVTLSQ
jgi:hypothetical protein